MATDTMTSPLSIVSQVIPDADQPAINSTVPAVELMDEVDDRSSSLSELGERAGHDDADNDVGDGSDANDTEAETERLEDTPQKIRQQQNVVLAPANSVIRRPQDSFTMPTWPAVSVNNSVPFSEVQRTEPTSEISSLAGSDQDIGKSLSPTPSSPWKRKRSSSGQRSLSDHDLLMEPSAKSTKLYRNTSASTLVDEPFSVGTNRENNQEDFVDPESIAFAEPRSKISPETSQLKQKYPKGKRKGKKIIDDGLGIMNSEAVREDSLAKPEEDQNLSSSEDEEDDNDETVDVPGADSIVKTEEGVIQKRSALDSLNAMEKCFATLRDKIFDERLAKCNEELAMLETPSPTHPELVAMRDVIDQRRDQRIHFEQTLLKYKLQTLQRESIANKAQAHSQYMQTVREIRDSHLERVNEKFYQLQRERQNADGVVPDYIYKYPTKRSQQITQQTSYNTEVSLLSGIAKHVGFPAAPSISKARPKEIEDDMRSMGVSQTSHRNPPILRATSSFARQRSGADEQFLEQNPWANPQHPSHHQPRQQLHRQISMLSRAGSPIITPATQTRVVDLTEPQESASTMPDHPSGPNSSTAVTPATAGVIGKDQSSHDLTNRGFIESTPSRLPEAPPPSASNLGLFDVATGKTLGLQRNKPEQDHSPSLIKNPSHDTHTPTSLPKPLPFMHTGGSSSTPALRTLTPGRYTVIKAEDLTHGARHSSMPRYHSPPVTSLGHGMKNQSAA